MRALARVCADHGGRAWVVGGGVRDHFMGQPIKDWDLEVFGIPTDDLVRLLRRLGKVNAVGRSFGVFKLRPRRWPRGAEDIDVSIPRRDSSVGPGHRGIHVEGDPDMEPKEAARRRDLTVNALMLDVLDGTLFDPWGGMRDLEQGVLRAVDADTFLEDPLRALRVVQFAARLGFDTHPSLDELCRAAALDELPAERICGEWDKLLNRAPRPSVGLAVARRTDVLQRVFPEAHTADHADVDRAVDGLVRDRDALDDHGTRWALMLLGWLHRLDAAGIEATLDRLWIHRVQGIQTRACTLAASAAWRDPICTDAELRHLSVRAELRLVLPLREALGDEHAARARTRAHELDIWAVAPPPLLQGRDLKALGIRPGRHMGDILRAVYIQQLDGAITTAEAAREAAQLLWAAHEA